MKVENHILALVIFVFVVVYFALGINYPIVFALTILGFILGGIYLLILGAVESLRGKDEDV